MDTFNFSKSMSFNKFVKIRIIDLYEVGDLSYFRLRENFFML